MKIPKVAFRLIWQISKRPSAPIGLPVSKSQIAKLGSFPMANLFSISLSFHKLNSWGINVVLMLISGSFTQSVKRSNHRDYAGKGKPFLQRVFFKYFIVSSLYYIFVYSGYRFFSTEYIYSSRDIRSGSFTPIGRD